MKLLFLIILWAVLFAVLYAFINGAFKTGNKTTEPDESSLAGRYKYTSHDINDVIF